MRERNVVNLLFLQDLCLQEPPEAEIYGPSAFRATGKLTYVPSACVPKGHPNVGRKDD